MFVAANAFLVTSIARERNESEWSDLQIVITPRIPLEDETPIWVGLPIILNRIDSVGELRFNAAAYQQPTWDDSDLAIVDYKMYSSAPIDMEKHLEGLKLGKVKKCFQIDYLTQFSTIFQVSNCWKKLSHSKV